MRCVGSSYGVQTVALWMTQPKALYVKKRLLPRNSLVREHARHRPRHLMDVAKSKRLPQAPRIGIPRFWFWFRGRVRGGCCIAICRRPNSSIRRERFS